MPKMERQKAKLLVLLDLLWRKTDEEHKLSVPQILEHLEQHGVPAERKSIYSDIEALRDAGVDVELQRGPHGGYYIAQRPFELAELKLLVDAVQASRFITKQKSTQLIKKLEGLASEYQGRQLHRQVVVTGRVKTMNKSVLYSVDGLHGAILADRQVSFEYLDWNLEKKRVPRHEGRRYQVSPWALVWNNDNYYLVACQDGPEGQQIRHYRVDKMKRIQVERNHPRQGRKEFARMDLAEYTKGLFGMFGGQRTTVQLRCRNDLVDVILDRFGPEVTLVHQQDDTFDLYADVVISQQFAGWICGLGGGVQVIQPPEARSRMRELARTLAEQYGTQEPSV